MVHHTAGTTRQKKMPSPADDAACFMPHRRLLLAITFSSSSILPVRIFRRSSSYGHTVITARYYFRLSGELLAFPRVRGLYIHDDGIAAVSSSQKFLLLLAMR